jgi:pimeloyl-ACP methyl ester carboxylesterase
MAEVVANGLRFHVQRRRPAPDIGRAEAPPTVVFVHGLGADNLTSLYYALGSAVAGAGAEVIFYDLRGHGRSERPPTGYGLVDAAADLRALLDALGVHQPVHLIGSSYGGMVVLTQAIAQPERVASMVLIDSQLVLEGRENTVTKDLAGYVGVFGRDDIRDGIGGLPRNHSKLARQTEALLLTTTLCEDLRAIEPFRANELRKIGCPVLGVYGGQSELVGLARDLERLLPDYTLEILPECTHLLLREAAADVRRLVPRWLAARAWQPRAPVRAARS